MILSLFEGVEGGETALKLARKWAYLTKGIPENQARFTLISKLFSLLLL